MISIENLSGSLAFMSAMIGLSPQIYKAFKNKSTGDVSMLMLANLNFASICWIIYGSCNNSTFAVLSNIAGFVLSLISIAQKIYYDRKTE